MFENEVERHILEVLELYAREIEIQRQITGWGLLKKEAEEKDNHAFAKKCQQCIEYLRDPSTPPRKPEQYSNIKFYGDESAPLKQPAIRSEQQKLTLLCEKCGNENPIEVFHHDREIVEATTQNNDPPYLVRECGFCSEELFFMDPFPFVIAIKLRYGEPKTTPVTEDIKRQFYSNKYSLSQTATICHQNGVWKVIDHEENHRFEIRALCGMLVVKVTYLPGEPPN